MKRIPLIVLAFVLLLFVVAADSAIPEVVVLILTAVAVPLLVELIKLIVVKVPSTAWLANKAAASVIAFLIAVGVAAVYSIQWGQLPPLPADPMEAFSQLMTYASVIYAASTGLYNLVLAKILDGLAKPGNLFAYKLK